MKRNYSPSYLKAIVIVHGKSEKQICDFIKSKLRIRIEIESDKNGEKSIQITSLKNTLNRTKFKNFDKLKTYFEIDKTLSDDFKIFIIMDTDDCTEEQKKAFINKTMFQNHWAYNYIVPIYNSPNLEKVLEKCNIKFEKKGEKRKTEYIKIFPTDKKYAEKETIQLENFKNSLEKNNCTNMNEFIQFCLNLINNGQNSI